MTNELVKRLSESKHEVVMGHRDEPYEEIKERIEASYIHIKFTQARGGTALGINVDLKSTNVKGLNFIKGEVYLELVSEEPINSHSTFN